MPRVRTEYLGYRRKVSLRRPKKGTIAVGSDAYRVQLFRLTGPDGSTPPRLTFSRDSTPLAVVTAVDEVAAAAMLAANGLADPKPKGTDHGDPWRDARVDPQSGSLDEELPDSETVADLHVLHDRANREAGVDVVAQPVLRGDRKRPVGQVFAVGKPVGVEPHQLIVRDLVGYVEIVGRFMDSRQAEGDRRGALAAAAASVTMRSVRRTAG